MRLGDLNLDNKVNDGAEPVDIPISRIITHEQYNQRDITNDIALLKMEKRASFNREFFKIRIVSLTRAGVR